MGLLKPAKLVHFSLASRNGAMEREKEEKILKPNLTFC